MKSFLLSIAGFVAIGLFILNGVGFLSLTFLGNSSFYKPEFVRNGVEENEFDYVVLGSSNGLTTLDTRVIDSLSGLHGLNISMDDSGLSSQFLMLQHFYAAGKTTKRVILAVSHWDLANAKPALSGNDYRFLPYVAQPHVSAYYAELEHVNLKVLAWSKYFPAIGVSYYNTKLFYPSLLAALRPSMKNRFDNRGNYSYPASLGEVEELGPKTITLQLGNRYYFRLKQFCSEHKIRLIVYQGPQYNASVKADDIGEVVNHSSLLKDRSLFYDNVHVNSIGRRVCSEELAKYLKQPY